MASAEFGSLSLPHSPIHTTANGTAILSRESALFRERILTGGENDSPPLILASPLSEFHMQTDRILSVRKDQEWTEHIEVQVNKEPRTAVVKPVKKKQLPATQNYFNHQRRGSRGSGYFNRLYNIKKDWLI